jgi:transposase
MTDVLAQPDSTTPCYVGIDVAKAWLDVAVRPSGAQWRAANVEAALPTLVEQVRAVQPQLVVLEATGGYERAAVAALAAAGLPVVVVNPRQVRHLAQATGRLAKTDVLDAHVLAHVAEAVHPQPRPLTDEATQRLAALLERRSQLVALLTAEKNRRQQALESVRPSLRRLSPGSNRPWSSSPRTWTRPCTPVPSGASARICSAVFPASARSSR